MTTKKFSVREAIGFGWKIMRDNLGLYIKIYIMAGFFIITPRIISEFFGNFLVDVTSLIVVVLFSVIYIGTAKISLVFNDNSKSDFTDFFYDFSLFIKCFIGLILYALIINIGTLFSLLSEFYIAELFLMLLGFYFGITLIFTPYIIIDKGYGPIAALKESYRITKGIFWDMVTFSLLLYLILLLGIYIMRGILWITLPVSAVIIEKLSVLELFLLGIIITLPMCTLATAFVYRSLLADYPSPKNYSHYPLQGYYYQ